MRGLIKPYLREIPLRNFDRYYSHPFEIKIKHEGEGVLEFSGLRMFSCP